MLPRLLSCPTPARSPPPVAWQIESVGTTEPVTAGYEDDDRAVCRYLRSRSSEGRRDFGIIATGAR